MKTNRRQFLERCSAVAGAAAVPYLFSSAQPVRAQAPSDQLRVGCIGVGAMGRANAQDFSRFCDVAAIADVDSEYGIAETLRHPRIGTIRSGQKEGNPDSFQDYRRILDREDIDIVSIGTPDHWHVKIAIEALQTGKHVFCEKPLTLTVEEGELIRNAVKRYPNLVFQVGSQQRLQKNQFATACLMVRKGMLGEIKRMTVDIGGGGSGGPFEKTTPPDSLDFDRWLGQCPVVEYIPQRVHRTFRYWYEYSGGTLTDWGAHHVDFVHWALGEVAPGQGPVSFEPIVAEHPISLKDGYPTVDDCYNTLNRFEILCKFASGVELLVCSHSQDGNGVLIEGTQGRMHVNRERIKGKPIEDGLQNSLTEDDFTELFNGRKFDNSHKRNFINCIREGGLPVSDAVSHVQAMNSCHLSVIAARLGREIKWDPKTEKVIGDDQAATFLARERRAGYDIPSL